MYDEGLEDDLCYYRNLDSDDYIHVVIHEHVGLPTSVELFDDWYEADTYMASLFDSFTPVVEEPCDVKVNHESVNGFLRCIGYGKTRSGFTGKIWLYRKKVN